MLKLKKKVNQFPTPYTCMRAIKEGGIETKLSMILMGFGNFCTQTENKRTFIFDFGSGLYCFYGSEWKIGRAHV